MCGGHHEIFSCESTTGSLQEGSHVGAGWICEFLWLWDWRECGKKEQFQALHANMNELVVFQDIARFCFW